MSKYKIKSNSVISGEVEISGAKNSALPILCAALLCAGKSEIINVPDLSDISVMLNILEKIGCKSEFNNKRCIVDSSDILNPSVSFDLAGKIRASFLVAGPLLARCGYAKIALPGGCSIGSRPVDLHLKGFKLLGAEYEVSNGYVNIYSKKLKGNQIYLDFPSVGATQNLIMASVLAEGTTVIENCASEPEISDLIVYLNSCGAKIQGAGTDKITITGVEKINGCTHKIISDRVEAGTFMAAAVATGGRITLKNVDCSHLSSVSAKLSEVGASITEFANEISVFADDLKKSTDIKTLPFPGFPTDMQAQFASMLCTVKGTSLITETIFENRFMYIPELVRMNADIKLDGRTAIINGKGRLNGSVVKCTDLRAGAALVIAGLCADGETIINDENDFIKRGYSDFSEKLRKIGADITEYV